MYADINKTFKNSITAIFFLKNIKNNGNNIYIYIFFFIKTCMCITVIKTLLEELLKA